MTVYKYGGAHELFQLLGLNLILPFCNEKCSPFYRWSPHAARDARKDTASADRIHITTIVGIREAIQAEQIFIQAKAFRSRQLFASVRDTGKYSHSIAHISHPEMIYKLYGNIIPIYYAQM